MTSDLPCPVQHLSWRASSFPLRVDPSRFSDGPSCRLFLGRYRLNALFTRPSVAEATPMDLQDSGPLSPIEAVFLQFRGRAVKGDVWRDVRAAASESAGAGRGGRGPD